MTAATGDEHDKLLARARLPDGMLQELTSFNLAQNDLAKGLGLDICSGLSALRIFANGADTQILKVDSILPSEHCYISKAVFLHHFATNFDMWKAHKDDSTGRTFVNMIAAVTPMMQHICKLLGWAYIYVIVSYGGQLLLCDTYVIYTVYFALLREPVMFISKWTRHRSLHIRILPKTVHRIRLAIC